MNKIERNWALYDWANSAYTVTVVTAILPIFFKDVAAKGLGNSLSTAYWGYGNAISTLVMALLAPILGTMADYKGYKKRLFFVFLIIGVISTGMLATIGVGDWRSCILFYIISSIGYYGANVFYDSFLVDVTTVKKIDKISTIGFALGYIGSTIPFIASIVIIKNPGLIGVNSSLTATQISFIITAIWWLFFSIPMFMTARQRHYIEPSRTPVKDSFRRLFETIKSVKEYKSIFLFLIAYCFYIDGVSTIIKMAAVFGKDVGIDSASLLIILLVTQFVAVPFALLYGKLAKVFSAKKMIMVGIIVYTIITIFAFFIKTSLHFWILAMLVATSQGGIQALSRSTFGKLVPKNKVTEFFGLYDVFGKFSAIMGPVLVAIFTQITGASKYGVLSIIVLFVIGGYLLRKVDV